MLSVLGQALASVGHELNNAVGVVQSYAGFIQEAAKDPNVVDDALVIRRTTDKVAALARQLLAFGHPREREPEALELGPFLIDVQGFLRRAFGDACPIVLQMGAEPVAVLVRRAVLGRLLLDLALAMREGLAAGSGLRLGSALVSRDGARFAELWLREDREPGAVAPGVDVATCLDLATIRAQLSQHDGTLQTRLAPEAPLALTLAFPALDALAAPESAPPESVQARGSETVLVVEENGELRVAICRMLEAAGYRALEAEDSATARSLGLEGGVSIDLLLSSSVSSEVSLRALAAELQQLHQRLGVLQLSKPFSSAELQAAVRSALDDRARRSEHVLLDASRVLALVVDDDAHVRLALSRILSDVGADVVTAPSGLHALQKLQALPIDLLIADQLMPGMEGTRLLETAYKTWPAVVRVVYTGYLSSGLVVDAVNRANVHKVLAKDMAPEQLRQQLAEVVAEIRVARPA
jgi:CheY-like chemotaxis protein